VREQLILSLLAWAVVVICYFVTKWRGGSITADEVARDQINREAKRVLVLANETVTADELIAELHKIDDDGDAEYFVCVPANPVDTHQAERKGAVFLWEATVEAAQKRLNFTLETLQAQGLTADGALGDYRPLRALAEAVESFHPDQIVISTLPAAHSVWLRHDVVDRAREAHQIPVTHVESDPAGLASSTP